MTGDGRDRNRNAVRDAFILNREMPRLLLPPPPIRPGDCAPKSHLPSIHSPTADHDESIRQHHRSKDGQDIRTFPSARAKEFPTTASKPSPHMVPWRGASCAEESSYLTSAFPEGLMRGAATAANDAAVKTRKAERWRSKKNCQTCFNGTWIRLKACREVNELLHARA